MSQFFEGAEEHIDKQNAQSETRYGQKLLKRLLQECVGAERTRDFYYRGGEEFGFSWFNYEFPDFPIALAARRLRGVRLIDLFKRVTKTDVWTSFFEVVNENQGRHSVGLVFPLGELGDFIAHNCWTIDHLPGVTRLVRRAASEDKGMIIEPYNVMIQQIKRTWQI